MNITIYAKNIELTLAIKTYAEEKIGSLAKFLRPSSAKMAEAKIEVGKPSEHHKTGLIFYAEVDLAVGGRVMRATTQQADLYAAIDEIKEELERQIKKDKEKKVDLRRRAKSEE